MIFKEKLKTTLVLAILVASVVVVYKKPINLGLDLQGGTQLILIAKDTPKVKVDDDAVLGAIEVIRNRIDGLGIAETSVRRKGTQQKIGRAHV